MFHKKPAIIRIEKDKMGMGCSYERQKIRIQSYFNTKQYPCFYHGDQNRELPLLKRKLEMDEITWHPFFFLTSKLIKMSSEVHLLSNATKENLTRGVVSSATLEGICTPFVQHLEFPCTLSKDQRSCIAQRYLFCASE